MIILTNVCFIILILSFAIPTNCQTCIGSSQYEQCSSNPACGCFQMAFAINSSICAYLGVTCSNLAACDHKYKLCYQSNHVCVHHPRCFTHPICYPSSKIDQQFCPPIPPGPPRPGDGICATATWAQNATIVAGGRGMGSALDQLYYPFGLSIDINQTIYVADFANHRIVKWNRDASTGELVAGGNGHGTGDNQLNYPSDVVVDRNGTMYISDSTNLRVQQWFQNAPNGHTVVGNISIHGLAQDDEGLLYITDIQKGEVTKWRLGETTGQVIASGFIHPLDLFVDRDRSVYFVENSKHEALRIDSKTGQIIRVAGGSFGNHTDQLAYPNSIIVDQLGTVYVADTDNNRIIRWPRGATSGIVIAGGRGQGDQLDQFWSPTDLSFDLDGNLYVADTDNHRIQKFAIDRSSC